MQERIEVMEISSDFQLRAAVESLKFYWNLAKNKSQTIAFELWAEPGAVVPESRATLTTNIHRGKEFDQENDKSLGAYLAQHGGYVNQGK